MTLLLLGGGDGAVSVGVGTVEAVGHLLKELGFGDGRLVAEQTTQTHHAAPASGLITRGARAFCAALCPFGAALFHLCALLGSHLSHPLLHALLTFRPESFHSELHLFTRQLAVLVAVHDPKQLFSLCNCLGAGEVRLCLPVLGCGGGGEGCCGNADQVHDFHLLTFHVPSRRDLKKTYIISGINTRCRINRPRLAVSHLHDYIGPVISTLYNREILRLAASIPHHRRLATPQATAEKRSPVCGSRIVVDVVLDETGRVSEVGQEVRACALGQASAAVMGSHAIGRSPEELASARDELAAFLDGRRTDPGSWPGIELFKDAQPLTARHKSILLSFEAAAQAADEASR